MSFHSHVLLNYPGAQNCNELYQIKFWSCERPKETSQQLPCSPFFYGYMMELEPPENTWRFAHMMVYLPALAANDFLMLWARRTAANLPSRRGLHLSWNQPTWQRNRLMALGMGRFGLRCCFPMFSHVFLCFPIFPLVMSGKMMSLDHCLGFEAATFLAQAVAMGLHFWTSIHTS